MNVTKRDGRVEPLDLEKYHQMNMWAAEGLANVSVSEVELNASLQFYDGMKTSDLHKLTTKSAADLIDVRTPNYQYLAARLLLMELRKEVSGQFEPMSLNDTIKKNVALGFYENIHEYFTEEEVDYYDGKINHNRDFDFTYSGLRTVIDKYIVKDKVKSILLETPQQLFMLVSMILFKSEEDRAKLIIDYYNRLSSFEISLPSPIMSGVRTPVKGYSSCCLIDTGDSTKTLNAANGAAVVMTTIRAGIGLHNGHIRGIGAPVSNGTVLHTGITPILRWHESAVKAFSQGSRGGGATSYHAFWNWEIEKVMTLKSNKSTAENSVRKLDYGIGFNKLFFDRARKDEKVTLFSSEETRELYTTLNDYDTWVEAYKALENKRGIRKKRIKARKLLRLFATEYFETGRLYPIFLDNANRGPLKDALVMSNLCAEIFLPVKPLQHTYDPNGEIALCILSNVNAGRIKNVKDIERTAHLMVRSLDNLIDAQEYPLPAAENPTVNARYLGIGVSDWAHYLTKNKVRYDTVEALDLAEEFMEHLQFYLLKASNELAKERGAANWFWGRSKYADGWLPNDGKWRFIPKEDWEELRASIKKYGLRNNTLSAIPPAGTSSDVSGSTSGIDMPRDFLVTKTSKAGPVKQIVPNFSKGSSYYTLAFELDNIKYHEMIARFQLYVDQSISTNMYWAQKDLGENGKMSIKKIISVIVNAHKLGMKSIYYSTFEGEDSGAPKEVCEGGGCEV